MERHAFDDAPFMVFWETTQACDLVCKHCRADARPARDPETVAAPSGGASAGLSTKSSSSRQWRATLASPHRAGSIPSAAWSLRSTKWPCGCHSGARSTSSARSNACNVSSQRPSGTCRTWNAPERLFAGSAEVVARTTLRDRPADLPLVLNTIYEDDAGMVERREVGAVEPTPGAPGRQRSVGLPDPRKTKVGLFLATRAGS